MGSSTAAMVDDASYDRGSTSGMVDAASENGGTTQHGLPFPANFVSDPAAVVGDAIVHWVTGSVVISFEPVFGCDVQVFGCDVKVFGCDVLVFGCDVPVFGCDVQVFGCDVQLLSSEEPLQIAGVRPSCSMLPQTLSCSPCMYVSTMIWNSVLPDLLHIRSHHRFGKLLRNGLRPARINVLTETRPHHAASALPSDPRLHYTKYDEHLEADIAPNP